MTGSRYSLAVGVAFVALIVIATLNEAGNEDGILGTDPGARGTELPRFAVPDAAGPLTGDANVYQTDCAVSVDPCPAEARHTPACEVGDVGPEPRGEAPRARGLAGQAAKPPQAVQGAIRVCDFFDRPFVLSFWFTRFADCIPVQDELDRLSRRYRGRVGFLSVYVGDDREEVRSIAAEHGWTMAVGQDADGEVARLYRVGACPTVLFARRGGVMEEALIGDAITPGSMRREIESLLRHG